MIETIAERHRIPCKRAGTLAEDELICPGTRGHLWEDGDKLMICFTDDGARRPSSVRKKGAAIQKLGKALLRITQNAETEFCGELATDHASVERAIRVVNVRRFRVTKGISKPFPLALAVTSGISSDCSSGAPRAVESISRPQLGSQVIPASGERF